MSEMPGSVRLKISFYTSFNWVVFISMISRGSVSTFIIRSLKYHGNGGEEWNLHHIRITYLFSYWVIIVSIIQFRYGLHMINGLLDCIFAHYKLASFNPRKGVYRDVLF